MIVDDMLFKGENWNWQKYGVNVAIRGLTYGLPKDLKPISRDYLMDYIININ